MEERKMSEKLCEVCVKNEWTLKRTIEPSKDLQSISIYFCNTCYSTYLKKILGWKNK